MFKKFRARSARYKCKYQNVRGKYKHFRTEGNDYLNIMRAAGEKILSNFQGIYVEFEALQANILML